MTLQPTFGRVLIKPEAEHSSKRLIIPEAYKKVANQGEVVAVGWGRRHIDGKVYPPRLEKGQKVMFSPLRAYKFQFEGEQYVSIEDEDVICIIGEAKVEGN